MNGFVSALALLLALPGMAAEPNTMRSLYAGTDAALGTSPENSFWRAAPRVFAERDPFGKPVPGHRTEIRSRWTHDNLYFLFICSYDELHLKPLPKTKDETFRLWDWDVAEVFIGSDFDNIRHYREFEVSPQGEWVDLDVDLGKPHHEDGWHWNSGFQVMSRIDRNAKVWYGAMRIPYASVDTRPAAGGNTLRINLFRAQGPPSRHKAICWQPTNANSYHVPERFGILRMDTKP